MAEETAAELGFTEVADSGPAPVPKTPVLRLRGLPFSVDEDSVRQFFAGFNVVQVVIGKRAGRSTGEGYVHLDSTAAAAEAIAKLHRQTLGPRYIEVFESTEADLATAKSLSVDRMRGFVVRCRGLPYSATAQDVFNFFGPEVPVVRGIEGVVFTYAPDGRPTGEAFVELQTEDAQREALKKHKESIGARYIEIFVSTKVDMIQAIQQNRLVLGYSNRKRWLQQQGINLGPGGPGGGHMGHPQHMQPHHPQAHYGGPQQHHAAPRRHPQYGQVEEVTEMMSGFNMGGMGGHAVQVIGPGGQMLPPGTYQLEVARDANGKPQQRFAGYPGRGGRGVGGRGPGGPGPYPGGRGGPSGGMVMGGRGMQQQQYPPNRQQPQAVVPVSAGGGGGGPAVMVQEMPGQAGSQYMMQPQQQQYEQQQWAQQAVAAAAADWSRLPRWQQQWAQQAVAAAAADWSRLPRWQQQWAQQVMVQQQQPQQGGQQQAGLYNAAAASQQAAGIQVDVGGALMAGMPGGPLGGPAAHMLHPHHHHPQHQIGVGARYEAHQQGGM
ncbi:Epithelial splicing regulatory protein 1 [Tetrabaena socialis]|uniref:Epithelial splicing regulatory protein 1 n=1 Tax=Tetrabaena socialis TaxID=47790 RepID=A0A2J7ZKM5_9CHLO|nr:Epithelial splicing regulatory protein 1 [Tetrabaena socialis]|eukprot:PNH00813.1 Epithelial splicing regulatory protein 1 [Tetrabaena socialis]